MVAPTLLETWAGDFAADLRALLLVQVRAAACEQPTISNHTGTSGWTTPFSSEVTCTS